MAERKFNLWEKEAERKFNLWEKEVKEKPANRKEQVKPYRPEMENDPDSHYSIVKNFMNIERIKKYDIFFAGLCDEKSPIIDFPVMVCRYALKKSSYMQLEAILKTHPLDICPYLYFNIVHHWDDSKWTQKNMIINHFKKKNIKIPKQVNDAISILSDGMVKGLFEDDGRPNVEVVNPIQALMVNRFLCMQFEIVKVLWLYDKKSCFTNIVLIWVLIEGVRKEGIFDNRDSVDRFESLRRYFDRAMIQLLESAQRRYQDPFDSPIRSKSPVFKNRELVYVAGELNYQTFFMQTISRRFVTHGWNLTKPPDTKRDDDKTTSPTSQSKHEEKAAVPKQSLGEKLMDICKFGLSPRSKLYIHMIMYVCTYAIVAFYTLREKAKESNILRLLTLLLIGSSTLDEVRQAIGEKGKYRTCIKRWWSDTWNKLDATTILLYYVAIALDFAESSTARYLLATFTFIWCLKFYQFLRAFKSPGTYIIIIQKMLPHLWFFGLVAITALLGYGVFMTSILFPSHQLESWSSILMIFIRPYLLLFAETGIEEYEFAASSTVFSTPKIPVIYEVMIILGMCIFLLFGGILLLNLLIAVFSGVYEDVKKTSESLWTINDFQLLREFKTKPSYPIPFSVPYNLKLIFQRLMSNESKETKEQLSDNDRIGMEKKQKLIMEDYEKSLTGNLHLLDHAYKKFQSTSIVDVRESDIYPFLSVLSQSVSEKNSAMDKRVVAVSESLSAMDKSTSERYSTLDKRVVAVSDSLSAIDKRVSEKHSALDKRMNDIWEQNKKMSSMLQMLIESRDSSYV